MPKKFKYIYGPVSSWRLGRSLGVDIISQKKKVCNFNCAYCQISQVIAYRGKRKIFVPLSKIIKELKALPDVKIDFITFSGMGEPTLAKNLGSILKAVKKIRKEPIAVLTNSFLMTRADVRKELALADFVIAKIDAWDENIFRLINSPASGIDLKDVIKGIIKFRQSYKKTFALQIMFIKETMHQAPRLADLAREVGPDLVQINTPLRPSLTRPLTKAEMNKVKKCFTGLKVESVYDAKRKRTIPINRKSTSKRHPK